MAEAILETAKDAEVLRSALNLMQEALQFLDEGGAPADIGADLDSAIVRLTQHMANLTV